MLSFNALNLFSITSLHIFTIAALNSVLNSTAGQSQDLFLLTTFFFPWTSSPIFLSITISTLMTIPCRDWILLKWQSLFSLEDFWLLFRQEVQRITDHHWLDERESEWTLGVGDGQGGLACCNSWGRKESDMTERLIWSDTKIMHWF